MQAVGPSAFSSVSAGVTLNSGRRQRLLLCRPRALPCLAMRVAEVVIVFPRCSWRTCGTLSVRRYASMHDTLRWRTPLQWEEWTHRCPPPFPQVVDTHAGYRGIRLAPQFTRRFNCRAATCVFARYVGASKPCCIHGVACTVLDAPLGS